MSNFERNASPTASMREKSLLKRRINKEHNSNFRAGYVNVNEEHLHKTGIRGRKRFVVCLVMTLLAVTVIVNVLITACILTVLCIGREGMHSLEFIPKGRLLRFLNWSDMGDVYMTDPVVGSLPYGAVELAGEEGGSVHLNVISETSSSVVVKPGDTVMYSTEGLEITDPDTGDIVFTTDSKEQTVGQRLKSVGHLKSPQVLTDRVTSGTMERLNIEATGTADLFGSEGVEVKGRQITVTARDDLEIFAKGDVTLDGAKGSRFSFYNGLPIKPLNESVRENVVTYKLCIRSPEGILYSVPWDVPCHTDEVPIGK